MLIAEKTQGIGSPLFCLDLTWLRLLCASQPPCSISSDQSALQWSLEAIGSPMFSLQVRQHIHILDRHLKASQSLSAWEELKKMTHLPNVYFTWTNLFCIGKKHNSYASTRFNVLSFKGTGHRYYLSSKCTILEALKSRSCIALPCQAGACLHYFGVICWLVAILGVNFSPWAVQLAI